MKLVLLASVEGPLTFRASFASLNFGGARNQEEIQDRYISSLIRVPWVVCVGVLSVGILRTPGARDLSCAPLVHTRMGVHPRCAYSFPKWGCAFLPCNNTDCCVPAAAYLLACRCVPAVHPSSWVGQPVRTIVEQG